MRNLLIIGAVLLGFFVSAVVTVVVVVALMANGSNPTSGATIAATQKPRSPSRRERETAKRTYERATSALSSAVVTGGQCPTHLFREFEEAIRLDPSAAEYHIGLGAVYGSCGMLKESIQEFEVALLLDPASEAAATNLALARQLRETEQLQARLMAQTSPQRSCPEYRDEYRRDFRLIFSPVPPPLDCPIEDISDAWRRQGHLIPRRINPSAIRR